MYVFGVDVPLTELLFVFVMLGIVLSAVLIYVMLKVLTLNRKIDSLLKDEGRKMKEFAEITEDEKRELKDLKSMKSEMDKLVKEEEQEIKLLKGIKKAESSNPIKKDSALKGKSIVSALFGPKQESEPFRRTEKWNNEGLVLVVRDEQGNVKEWGKHPLSNVDESQHPWRQEHWKPEGDVMVLRHDDGTLIDWEKLPKNS